MNHIIPTAVKYQNRLIDSVKGLKEILDAEDYTNLASRRIDVIKRISIHTTSASKMVQEMTEERRKANILDNSEGRMKRYIENVSPFLENIRNHVDELELIVDNEMWPLPKYRELLFNR